MTEMQEVYENPSNQAIKKPSKFWYLLPILLSVIGGIVGYIVIKGKDRKMARNILIVGFIILIIQVVFVGLSYTFALTQFMIPGIGEGQRLSKSVVINSFECSPGNPGTLKFTIKNTGTSTIYASDLTAFFDSETVPLAIDSISAGSVSKEISFSKSIDIGNHNLIISAPAGDVEETVFCSSP